MKDYIKYLVLVACLCFLKKDLIAQQTPSFSEYNFNPFVINPAYAGFDGATEITANGNGSISEFDGSPRNLAVTINSPLNSDQVGLGAGIIRDEIGLTAVTSLYGAYSYKIFFDLKRDRPHFHVYTPNAISFGITAGVQFYQNNLLALGIDDDENFSQNINTAIPIIGAGFLWNTAQFYAGISSPNLLTSNDEIDLRNTYYAYTGYRFFSTPFSSKIIIKPSILAKYEDGAPLQVDFNTSVTYADKLEFGLGYRTTSSVNFLAGIYASNNLRFIYSYNQNFGNSVLASTHGIMLSYRFGKGFKNN